MARIAIVKESSKHFTQRPYLSDFNVTALASGHFCLAYLFLKTTYPSRHRVTVLHSEVTKEDSCLNITKSLFDTTITSRKDSSIMNAFVGHADRISHGFLSKLTLYIYIYESFNS